METAKGYDVAKKSQGSNMSGDYSPNAGEGHMTFDSSGSRSGTSGISDSAGVQDGLAAVDGFEAKNAEMVSENQRPEGRREGAGEFEIGC